MWNPENYRDRDYGLPDDEHFEPGDAGDAEVADETEPHIMTVLGPIEPEELGICLPDEHIVLDVGEADRLDRIDLAALDLETFVTLGGRSIVDGTTPDQGRSLTELYRLAQRLPVHIIAVTALPAGGSVEQQRVLDEIGRGTGSARVRPGMLVIPDSAMQTENEAAWIVAKSTGLPVAVRSARDPVSILEQASTFGVAPGRVQFVGLRAGEVTDAHRDVARRGSWISISGIGRDGPDCDTAIANVVDALVRDGLDDRVLLSHGFTSARSMTAYGGGPGWGHLLERFVLDLMEAGIGADQIRTILIENPAAALTIWPPDTVKAP